MSDEIMPRSARSTPEEMAERVAAARARFQLSQIVGLSTVLEPRSVGRPGVSVGACPECRSTQFHVDDARGFYHCFGCGEHGDIMSFVRWRKGFGYGESIRFLESLRL